MSLKSIHSRCSSKDIKDDCKDRCIYRCVGCGLHHAAVECGGIYYCPTPGCTVSGAAWWRSKLKSYREVNGKHTVNPLEAVVFAAKHKVEDPAISAVRDVQVRYWFGLVDDENYEGLDMTEYLPVLATLGLLSEAQP